MVADTTADLIMGVTEDIMVDCRIMEVMVGIIEEEDLTTAMVTTEKT